MKIMILLALLASCGSKADEKDIIKAANSMAVNYCGQGNTCCIDYMVECILDEGLAQYNFCMNDYEDHTKGGY